jgi:choloylglycine hydrolase
MSRSLAAVSAFAFALATLAQGADACTAITLRAEDGTVVQARTLEWGAFNLGSQLMIVPRGIQFVGTTPDAKPGLAWKGAYGVVGINGVGRPLLIDGMNEKGLAVSLLYHPGFAEYQPYDANQAASSISQSDLPTWMLTSFATTAQVRSELPKIRVVPVKEESLGAPAPIHLIVTDAAGSTIVIEYIKGRLNIYENPVGVLTNDPGFPWHLTNLANYLGLQAREVKPIKIGNLELKPLGVGSGMLGLPGDYTPPSRFVRAVALRNTVRPLENGEAAVAEAFRILNAFDIPLGATGSVPKDDILGETQWTSAMDTKSLRYYYRTMYNHRIRAVDLKAIDLGNGGIRYQPLDPQRKQDYENVVVE